jgi:hypothetical protein
MYTKNSFKMLAIILSLIGFTSVGAYSANITWDGDGATDNWFEAANWQGDVIPGFDDTAIIDDGSTVILNGAADVNNLEVTNGVLRPDASSGRTIVIRRDLTVGANGSILYTNTGGTGRLSWTFQAEDGTNTIDNQTDDEALLQFYDVTINGTIDTESPGAGNGNMQIYGDLTINGAFQPSNVVGESTVHFVGIGTEPGKTISNNGTLEFNAVELSSNADISTITDFAIIGDLTIGAGSTLAINSPATLTTDDTDANAVTYTNNGDFTFAAGTAWDINKDLTVAQDINDFDGDLTLAGGTPGAVLTFVAGMEIEGAGSFTAGNQAGIVVADADGVAGAINLSGTKTWPTGANAVNITLETGSTGFSGVGLSVIHDLTLGTDTGAALALTTNESFEMTGDLAITQNTGAVTSFTASSGTITMSGADPNTINANDETLSFFGLSITGDIQGDASDATEAEGFTVTNSFAIPNGGTLSINNVDAAAVAYNINLVGDVSFEVVDADAFQMLGDADGIVTINIQGTTTLLDDWTIDATADVLDNFYLIDLEANQTLDCSTFFISMTSAGQDEADFTSASGSTIRVGVTTGLNAAIVLGNPNIQVEYADDTDFVFTDDAAEFGFDAAEQTGGAPVDIGIGGAAGGEQVTNITIDGAAITNVIAAANADLEILGDLTVTSGSLIIPDGANDVITFGDGAANGNHTITNSTGSEDNLVFNILDINTTGTIEVDGDISIARAGAGGLTSQAAGTLDMTTNEAALYLVGAALDIENATGATLNLQDVIVEAAATINANNTTGLLNIAGDLTVTTGNTLTTGGAAAAVVFNGADQTIDAPDANSLNLSEVDIAGTNVVTDDAVTFGSNDADVDVSGSLVASDPSIVTIAGAGAFTVSNNSATFFNLTFGGAATGQTGDYAIISAVDGAGEFDPDGTVTFFGDPGDLDSDGNYATDAITNDDLQQATISNVTFGNNNAGTIEIDNNCELQVSVAVATAIDFNVDGRLELTIAAAAMGDASTVDLTFGDGGTLHLSDLDGANANDLDDAVATNGTLTSDETSTIILNGTNTTLFNGGPGGALTVGDLIFNSGAAITLEAGDIITLHGTLTLSGTDNVADDGDVDSEIIMAGATSSITGSQVFSVGSITVQAAATGATIDADQIILEEDATAVVEVATDGSLTCSAGEIQINGAADAGVANIINGNADGSGLVFNDLTINAAATETDFDSGITVSGSLDVNATGKLHAISASGVLTMDGVGESFIYDLNVAGDIELFDVIIDGSITIAQDGLEDDELIEIFGDLTVTGNGSLAMTDGGISFGDGNGAGTDGTDVVTITNDGTLQFHDLDINKHANTDIVAVSDNYTIDGDLTVTSGEFRNTSNDVTFEGTGTLLSEGVNASTTFNNVNFDGTTTLGGGGLDINIAGNIVVSSGNSAQRSAVADLVTFIGSSDKEISNDGTLAFGALTVANEEDNNLTTGDSFTISGAMTIGGATGGTFEATGGTVTFNGAGVQAVTNATTNSTDLQFNHILGTGAGTIIRAANEDFYINGNITLENNAVLDFQNADLRLFLGGDNQQVVTLNRSATEEAQMLLHDVTLNNPEGLQLASVGNSITDDQFDIEGTFRLSDGDIDLNGDNVLTIDVAGGGDLDEDYTNNHLVINNGPNTSTGNVLVSHDPGTDLSSEDFGGLGAIISSDDPGPLTIRRYHIPRDIGGNSQASKYYSINATTADIDAEISFRYADDEITGLTEDDLILMYSDTEDGPWFKQTATLNKTLQRLIIGSDDAVTALTGPTEWWTMGTPSELSATAITNGLASNPLSAGTSDNAIYGIQYSVDGSDITVTNTQFDFGRNLNATTAEFTDYKLYYSSDDDYSTTSDNVELTDAVVSNGGTGDNNVSFDLSAVSSDYVTIEEGTPANYFLVTSIDELEDVNSTTITPQMTNYEISVQDGIVVPYTLVGENYAFRASIEVSPNENGLDETPLVAGETEKAIFGFKSTITSIAGLPGFTGFTLDFEGDPSAVFENVQVLESEDDSDFNTSGDNEVLDNLNVTITDSNMVFTFDEQNLSNVTPQYYFVTADVKNTVDPSVEPVTPTMVYSNITSVNAGVRGTDIDGNDAESHTGYTYDFIKATVTLGTSNNPATGNLGTNLGNQPIYGFTLTPDGGQSVTLDEAQIQVTFSDEDEAANVDQWKLYLDGNQNGYGDANDDAAINGTYENGVLTFEDIDKTFTSETHFIVTARVKGNATAGTTISAQILGEDYLTINSPNTINAGGPFPATASVHTVRASGNAVAFEIAGTYETTVITGNTLSFIVRAVDADGYPARVTAATAVTLEKDPTTDGTVGGTNTGTIGAGTGFTVVNPTITHVAVSTNLTIRATGGLTNSAYTDAITILLGEPGSNDGEVILADITATTIGITDINAATTAGNGRIVVMKQGGRPEAPVNGISYTPSLDISDAGDVGVGQTGPGSYVVYDTEEGVTTDVTGLSIDIEGLVPGKRYYFMVFEYNGTDPNYTYASETSWTSDAVQNPKFVTTLDGALSNADSTAAVNLPTNIDVTSSVASSGAENWFKFRVSGSKTNAEVIISNLPANYNIDIYDGTGGVIDLELLRQSQVTGTSREVLIMNDLSPSETYYIKVYGDDDDQYSSTNYTIRVSTSAEEFYSLTEE